MNALDQRSADAADLGTESPQASRAAPPRTLTVDIGGSGTKAAVFDAAACMLGERVRIPTPVGEPPDVLLAAIAELASGLPPFERVAAGFPGVVRGGAIVTAPNLGHDGWVGMDLARELERTLGRPARALNDADLLGLGVIRGRGLEVFITLGTGVGFAVYQDGRLGPRLELAHHPLRKRKTYNEVLGDRARRKAGRESWNRRVREAIEVVRTLTCFDRMYIAGGNASKIDFELAPDIEIAASAQAMAGGVAAWRLARV